MQFEWDENKATSNLGLKLTPKEFANYSPGLLQPWEGWFSEIFNSEGVGQLFQS
jgi:hypothetical protein